MAGDTLQGRAAALARWGTPREAALAKADFERAKADKYQQLANRHTARAAALEQFALAEHETTPP